MKNYLWSIPLFVLAMGFGSSVMAQKGSFSTNATIGITSPILDNGIGFHLGVNPSYALFSHLSIEGQVSYIHTDINGYFISGGEGTLDAGNALVGGRLYLTHPDNQVRPYINLLFGGNFTQEKRVAGETTAMFLPGFSAGGFLEIHKFLVGVTFDSPKNIILKAGYIF